MAVFPRVALQDVSKDTDKCPICQIRYLEEDPESGYAEHPIMLPCQHLIGKHCAMMWLKPTPGGNANTCPLCRYKLFEPWPAPSDTESETSQASTGAVNTDADDDFTAYIRAYPPHVNRPRDRQIALGRIAFYRRDVSIHEASLYLRLQQFGVELPGEVDVVVLDYRQDQALFEYLQRHGAFRGVRLNNQYREETRGPLRGHRLDNYAVWSRLRDNGIWWKEDHHDRRGGFWLERYGDLLYPDEDEDDADNFEELMLQGAFSTPGINRRFRSEENVSPYYIFLRLMEMGVTWDEGRHIWVEGGQNVFGDAESEPEERRMTPRAAPPPRSGPRVVYTESPHRRPEPPSFRLWDGRRPGWRASRVGDDHLEQGEEDSADSAVERGDPEGRDDDEALQE